MLSIRKRLAALLAVTGLSAVAGPMACAAGDPPAEDALALGARIYAEGRGEAGTEIIARVGGDDGLDVPAWTLPCVTCHGRDGAGGLPGQAVTPTDIRWPALRQARVTESGRDRPAYDGRDAVRRAVTEGFDAGGQEMSAVMPRYRLSDAQWSALATYLETLGAADAAP